MSKFATNLKKSNKAIKAQRADIIAESTQAEHEDLVRDLKKTRRELRTKLMGLEDLSPDSQFSNNVVKGDFDAKAWAKSMQSIKVEILNNKIELQVAEETTKEWFSETK